MRVKNWLRRQRNLPGLFDEE